MTRIMLAEHFENFLLEFLGIEITGLNDTVLVENEVAGNVGDAQSCEHRRLPHTAVANSFPRERVTLQATLSMLGISIETNTHHAELVTSVGLQAHQTPLDVGALRVPCSPDGNDVNLRLEVGERNITSLYVFCGKILQTTVQLSVAQPVEFIFPF